MLPVRHNRLDVGCCYRLVNELSHQLRPHGDLMVLIISVTYCITGPGHPGVRSSMSTNNDPNDSAPTTHRDNDVVELMLVVSFKGLTWRKEYPLDTKMVDAIMDMTETCTIGFDQQFGEVLKLTDDLKCIPAVPATLDKEPETFRDYLAPGEKTLILSVEPTNESFFLEQHSQNMRLKLIVDEYEKGGKLKKKDTIPNSTAAKKRKAGKSKKPTELQQQPALDAEKTPFVSEPPDDDKSLEGRHVATLMAKLMAKVDALSLNQQEQATELANVKQKNAIIKQENAVLKEKLTAVQKTLSPIYLRAFLDQTRDKLFTQLGITSVDQLLNKPTPPIDFVLQTLRSQTTMDVTYNAVHFLLFSNSVRYEGNRYAHSASHEQIHEALLAVADAHQDKGHLEVWYTYMYNQTLK
ncbi:hypothetical protein D9615_006002 [Tricholomella constricta]|uniref:Uncharacterized protein n=1 Tax=Tricholomella constricta TaxID=117010 RepID=A0A8H5M3D9_9AGAR|nr:hypothetical protein D9615_006002 [Tricholomella constricta]